MKNVTVEIAGATYPLCMTVAAMEQICEKFGSLPNLLEAVRAEDPAKALENTTFALGVLIQEGEENRLMVAACYGENVQPRRKVPGPEQLRHLLLPGQVVQYQLPVLEAVNASMQREVEVAPAKNAGGAEGS